MKHITTSERLLQWQYNKQLEYIKELELQLSEYRESFETMKESITELKELNKILTKQIYSLSHNSCLN